MNLFQRISAWWRPKAEPAQLAPSPYPDEEFLNVVMAQARRPRDEQENGQPAAPRSVAPGSLPNAA